MTNDHPTSSPTLNAATNALRNTHIPAGPPPELITRVLMRLHSPTTPTPLQSRRSPWPILPRWKTLALAASVLFCAGLIAILLPYGPGANTAFAQILRQIETAQTLTFTAITHDKGLRHVSHVMLKQPGLMRVESADGIITTTNFQTGKILAIYPASKKALAIDLNNRPGFMTPHNFLDELKKVIAANATPLGEKQQAGQTLQGYRVAHDGNSQNIWINPATNSPVQIDIRGPSNAPANTPNNTPDNGIVMTWTNITFNSPLNDTLFTTTPPPDYTLSQSQAAITVIGQWPTEKNLLIGLELAARHNNNTFPARLEDVSARLINQSNTTNPHNPPTTQTIETVQNIGLAAAFESMLPPESHYTYAAQGIQLGDPQTPICWWKPQNQPTWTIIYANLRTTHEPTPPTSRSVSSPSRIQVN